MKVSIEKPGTPEELVELTHHGVKGMRWGVRKAYAARVSKVAEAHKRVGSGQGSLIEKYHIHKQTTPLEAIVRGGYGKAATKRGENWQAHADRLDKGEAHVHDYLTMVGNLNMGDIIRGRQLVKSFNKAA